MAENQSHKYLTKAEVTKLVQLKTSGDRVGLIDAMIEARLAQYKQGWSVSKCTKILLLGPEGSGKSSIGNLLLGTKDGQEPFPVTRSEVGTTSCKTQKAEVDGLTMEVVDTPGNAFTMVTGYLFQKRVSSENDPALLEIRDHLKSANVIIVVLNSSYKRDANMGIPAIMKEFLPASASICMMVATHCRSHYDGKTTFDLLGDLSESPEMRDFLQMIHKRVVMVELGDEDPSSEVMRSGQAVFQAEKDQMRQMVLEMAARLM